MNTGKVGSALANPKAPFRIMLGLLVMNISCSCCAYFCGPLGPFITIGITFAVVRYGLKSANEAQAAGRDYKGLRWLAIANAVYTLLLVILFIAAMFANAYDPNEYITPNEW